MPFEYYNWFTNFSVKSIEAVNAFLRALEVEIRDAVGYRNQGIVESEARAFVRAYNNANNKAIAAVDRVMEESEEIRNELSKFEDGDVFGHLLVNTDRMRFTHRVHKALQKAQAAMDELMRSHIAYKDALMTRQMDRGKFQASM